MQMMPPFVCQHFPMMQRVFWSLLSQWHRGAGFVKGANYISVGQSIILTIDMWILHWWTPMIYQMNGCEPPISGHLNIPIWQRHCWNMTAHIHRCLIIFGFYYVVRIDNFCQYFEKLHIPFSSVGTGLQFKLFQRELHLRPH